MIVIVDRFEYEDEVIDKIQSLKRTRSDLAREIERLEKWLKIRNSRQDDLRQKRGTLYDSHA